MALGKPQLEALYRRRAGHYDLASDLYYLIGFRLRAYRRMAIDALELRPGDTVVDLCCGTGMNFPLLRDAVGRQGRVIGVDLSKHMLDKARERATRHGWDNIELVCIDAAQFRWPDSVDGVISTMALTLVPEYDAVIRRASQALRPGRSVVVQDLKRPAWAPGWLVRLGVLATRHFGVTPDLAARHPWESMRTHLDEVSLREFYFGFSYVAAGKACGAGSR